MISMCIFYAMCLFYVIYAWFKVEMTIVKVDRVEGEDNPDEINVCQVSLFHRD